MYHLLKPALWFSVNALSLRCSNSIFAALEARYRRSSIESSLYSSSLIRGHKLAMKPHESAMKIYCAFKSKDAMKILLWFDKLPFYHQYTIGSRSHFCVDVYLPSSETSNYLLSLKNLKQYTDEMLVQFVVRGASSVYCSERKKQGCVLCCCRWSLVAFACRAVTFY